MKRYEYDVTKHPSEKFSQMAYFCSDKGECNLSELPSDQTVVIKDILDEMGDQGWELVQLFFKENGVVAFWKREK